MKEKIHEWLDQIEKGAVIPGHIIVMNFGLYETDDGYCIYLAGASRYEETDDGWADELEEMPGGFFIEIETPCDWKEFQEQVGCILANEIQVRRAYAESPFRDKIVTTGFDDGVLTRIV